MFFEEKMSFFLKLILDTFMKITTILKNFLVKMQPNQKRNYQCEKSNLAIKKICDVVITLPNTILVHNITKKSCYF